MLKDDVFEAEILKSMGENLYITYLKMVATAASENGRLAGKKKKDLQDLSESLNEKQEDIELIIGILRHQKIIKAQPEGYMMDIIKETEEQPKKQTDYSRFIETWNGIEGVRNIRKLSDKRRHSLNARIRDYGEDTVIEVMRSMKKSDFLTGRVRSRGYESWQPDFDWFINPNNFLKVAEGKYDNKQENGMLYREEF